MRCHAYRLADSCRSAFGRSTSTPLGAERKRRRRWGVAKELLLRCCLQAAVAVEAISEEALLSLNAFDSSQEPEAEVSCQEDCIASFFFQIACRRPCRAFSR